MENQETVVTGAPRQMIHLQVAGENTQEDLVNILTNFQETLKTNGTIVTPDNVTANVITTTADLSGMILAPKMNALEIASVAVDVLRSYNLSQGENDSPVFADFDQDAKVEILRRIQFVLRFGALPTILSEDEDQDPTRDAIFESIVRALGSKLTVPNGESLIKVQKLAQKEGDADVEVSFNEINAGDLFKHGEAVFVAESDPYVNWIASPLPIMTIDAKLYQAPESFAEDAQSTQDENKVHSLDSNS